LGNNLAVGISAFRVQVSARALWALISITVARNPTTTNVILVFMIRFSIIVLVLGLQYNYMTLGLGAQTIRPGQTWPVSRLLGSFRSSAKIIALLQD
jgi:hypothetical protein